MTDALFDLVSTAANLDPNDPHSCALVPVNADSAANIVAFYKNHDHLNNAVNNIFKWPPDLVKAAKEISKAWPNEFKALGDQLATSRDDCFKNLVLYLVGVPAKVVVLFAEIPQWLATDIYLYFQAPAGYVDYYSS
jgi:hypothetical protein